MKFSLLLFLSAFVAPLFSSLPATAESVTISLQGTVVYAPSGTPVAPGAHAIGSVTYDLSLAVPEEPGLWSFASGDLAMTVEIEGHVWAADDAGSISVADDEDGKDQLTISVCDAGVCNPTIGIGLADLTAPLELLNSNEIPSAESTIDLDQADAQGLFIGVNGASARGGDEIVIHLTGFAVQSTAPIDDASWSLIKGEFRGK